MSQKTQKWGFRSPFLGHKIAPRLCFLSVVWKNSGLTSSPLSFWAGSVHGFWVLIFEGEGGFGVLIVFVVGVVVVVVLFVD